MKARLAQRQHQQGPRPAFHDYRPLSLSNANLETTGTVANPAVLWVDWIWKANAEEPFDPAILMNRSHLLGLLACRHMAGVLGDAQPPQPPLADDRMTLVAKHPGEYTLRELRDTVDNLLIEWPRFVERLASNPRAAENLQAVATLLDGCFARLGRLAQFPAPANVFDDAACTEPHGGQGLMRLSRPGLRRLLGSFMALYRHVDLLGRCKSAAAVLAERFPGRPQGECGLKKHHIEASTDDFHALCMHMLLPVAAKLNYRQDFPGMYNHVSQVIYFHNAQYERTPRMELEEILKTGEPMQAIPAICQIHPEIDLAYEEDPVDLSGPTGKWRWLVVPRRVYLVGPDSSVYHSESALELLELYKAMASGPRH
jgi:hypothetical protein